MSNQEQTKLGKTLWAIADDLRGAMNADSFRDYMLSFLFLRYLSSNYEEAAKKELGSDYPDDTPADVMEELKLDNPLEIWYSENKEDINAFESQMRKKVH
ncbi:MAG: type I restriction-modification system subunit M N-terminal domain-containing protein, partial [Cytophagales bacterium]|nr:type I restriction-modification system subunit M N-terminal domain-containing protein [Cytophagales bacterium]